VIAFDNKLYELSDAVKVLNITWLKYEART